MSGIYIKGMKMPTNCTECWFRKTARHEYLSDCQICPFTGETTPYTKRKDDCPLVPVPEHGDLIDRSELRISTAVPLDGVPYQYIHIDNINNAPAIIPADGNLYDSLKRGLEQAINGESRSETIPAKEGEG